LKKYPYIYYVMLILQVLMYQHQKMDFI